MKSKSKITQEDLDKAIANAYKLGYQTGKVEAQNRALILPSSELSLAEKQVLTILQKKYWTEDD